MEKSGSVNIQQSHISSLSTFGINRNITTFHEKLAKRYLREKSKKNEQTMKRNTFNVTYSLSGGSEVMPQPKEKIHTTEKTVKMFKY
jgi:hypothetical protein